MEFASNKKVFINKLNKLTSYFHLHSFVLWSVCVCVGGLFLFLLDFFFWLFDSKSKLAVYPLLLNAISYSCFTWLKILAWLEFAITHSICDLWCVDKNWDTVFFFLYGQSTRLKGSNETYIWVKLDENGREW